jgi:hypothetical protein
MLFVQIRSLTMQDIEQAIREHAYHLWVSDGRRDGNAEKYWLAAQRDVLAASLGSGITRRTGRIWQSSTPQTRRTARYWLCMTTLWGRGAGRR